MSIDHYPALLPVMRSLTDASDAYLSMILRPGITLDYRHVRFKSRVLLQWTVDSAQEALERLQTLGLAPENDARRSFGLTSRLCGECEKKRRSMNYCWRQESHRQPYGSAEQFSSIGEIAKWSALGVPNILAAEEITYELCHALECWSPTICWHFWDDYPNGTWSDAVDPIRDRRTRDRLTGMGLTIPFIMPTTCYTVRLADTDDSIHTY